MPARPIQASTPRKGSIVSKLKPKVDSEEVFDAIEEISTGLLKLDDTDLVNLGGKKLVDAVARMNTQANRLEDILRPLKDHIKNQTLTLNIGSNQQEFVYPGEMYQAIVRKISKTKIVAELVRKFVGPKNLHKVQEKTHEIQLSFGIKE